MAGIEPYTYMVKVLTKLPSSKAEEDIDKLLPWNHSEAILIVVHGAVTKISHM